MPDKESDRLQRRLEELERLSVKFEHELMRLKRDMRRHAEEEAAKPPQAEPTVAPEPAVTAEPAAVAEPATAPEPAAVAEPAVTAERAAAAKPVASPRPPTEAPQVVRKEKSQVDLEFWLGGRGLLLLGVLALVFAVGFFVKEAIERGWIGPAARVLLGAGVGVVALGVGERIRAVGYRTYGLWLAAGGFGAIYVSIWAGTALYGLVPTSVGFVMMVAVVAAAAALGLLRDSGSFVALAAVGGYLAPLLLRVEAASPLFGLCYLGLLSGAGLFVAYRTRWAGLAVVAILGGTMVALLSEGSPHLHGVYLALLIAGALLVARLREWLEVSVLTVALGWIALWTGKGGWEISGIVFAAYAAALWLADFIATVGVSGPPANVTEREQGAARPVRQATSPQESLQEFGLYSVTILPPVLFYVAALVGIGDSSYAESRDLIGLVLGFLIGAVYLGQTWLESRGEGEVQIWRAWLGFAFWLVAPCLLWSEVALARAWLLEGVVFTAVGIWFASVEARGAGLAAFAFAAMVYSAALVNRPDLDPAFISGWALTGLAVTLAIAAWPLAVDRAENPASWEVGIRPIPLLFAAVLFLAWGTVEIQRFFGLLSDAEGWNLARDLSISGFWMAYAVALLATGFWLKRPPVRWVGLGMALIAAGKVFLYDLSQLSQLYRIGSFILLAVVLLALSFRYQKMREGGEKHPS
jgi:uncharacterized membrane protein